MELVTACGCEPRVREMPEADIHRAVQLLTIQNLGNHLRFNALQQA
ncbi:hypothetical protein VWX97_08055 [Phaeobacter sp. JH18-32]